MTVILIGRYDENKSSTSIVYKKFAETDQDPYPTFSICLNGDGLYRYDGRAIYEAYGINSANYEKVLQGQLAFTYEYDTARKLYKKTPFPVAYKTNFTYEDVIQNHHEISDFFKEAEFRSKNPKTPLPGRSLVDMFYMSFQLPKMRCFTRKWKHNTSLRRIKDALFLDTFFLDRKFHTTIKIFVHYPGQLVRSLDTPIFTFEISDKTLYMDGLQIKVSQSAVWRKRAVKSRTCLEDIDDYDQYIQEAVSTKIGCVPPFWMNRVNLTLHLEECTSLERFKDLNAAIVDFEDVFDEFQTPCTDMFNSVVWNSLPLRKKFRYIEINYVDRYFEEIKQIEDFGVQDFISNLGGFIGIFLGYSMMQIPELLGKFTNTLRCFIEMYNIH